MPHVLVAAAVGLSAAACGGTIQSDGTSALLTTPSAATPVGGVGFTGETSRAVIRDVGTFTLANGTFRFTSENGELWGTYDGVVTAPLPGRSRVTMELLVTGGSDSFAGATGALVGEGSGAFVVGGDCVLPLNGVVQTTQEPLGWKFHTTVVGTATLSPQCSNNRQVLLLDGRGTIATAGRARMSLAGEIVETFCE
jgi:hypothetical protein